jgi:AcrR family transcriptional regulator
MLQCGSIVFVSFAAHEGSILSAGLPDEPDEALWPFLEAASRSVQRHGWARTTMRDIAREAGVERTTIYRHVGSMPDVYRLLVAYELHKLIRSIPSSVPADADGPSVVVELVAAAVEHCLDHPVLTKVISEEPELIASFLIEGVPSIIERVSELLDPTVALAMDAGIVARRDPTAITQWVARVGLSLLVAPPPGDLRAFLDAVLRPVLEPT